jgi:hypothetical protein
MIFVPLRESRTILGSLKFHTATISVWITSKHSINLLPGKFALDARPDQYSKWESRQSEQIRQLMDNELVLPTL